MCPGCAGEAAFDQPWYLGMVNDCMRIGADRLKLFQTHDLWAELEEEAPEMLQYYSNYEWNEAVVPDRVLIWTRGDRGIGVRSQYEADNLVEVVSLEDCLWYQRQKISQVVRETGTFG